MTTQLERKEWIGTHWNRYRELMPEVAQAYDALPQTVYAGGSLDAKTKRIMAMAIAVVCGCRGCMLYQTEFALELGAEVEELLEACGVAVSIGGTMAAAETSRVMAYLEERGLLTDRPEHK